MLENLPKRVPMPLHGFLEAAAPAATAAADHRRARQMLNGREKVIFRMVMDKRLTENLVIDLARSVDRVPSCIGASPCVLPNSHLYWVQGERFLTAREHLALQGIWACDFPALDSWAQTSLKSNRLRDLAGNAFTSTVRMSVCFAAIITAT